MTDDKLLTSSRPLPSGPPPPDYNDRPFRITAVLLVSIFVAGYGGKDFFSMFLRPGFYLELAVTICFTALLVWWISAATRRLDKNYDWKRHGLQRAMLQVCFGIVIPGIIEFILASLYFRAFGINILHTTFLAYAFPLIMMLILLFNFYYFAFYIYLAWIQTEVELGRIAGKLRERPEASEPEYFEVPFGTQGLAIPVNDIHYFYRLDKFNYVKTARGDKHIISQTLDDVEQMLNEGLFFRLNRQVIVHFNVCKRYEDGGHDKLNVIVEPPLPLPRMNVVSQRKAPKFKGWMEKTAGK